MTTHQWSMTDFFLNKNVTINSPYNSSSDSLTHITPAHLIKRPTNNNLNFK